LNTLVTIPISHYCEKARWALERAGIPYREQRHIQGVHTIASRWAGGGPTVPVLVAENEVIADSALILDWADERMDPERRLFPAGGLDRLEEQGLCLRLDERLGPAARRLTYIHMLPQRRLLFQYNNQGVPGWEDRTMRWAWPVVFAFARRALGIRPGVAAHDERVLWDEMDKVAGLLADGRPFLSGDRFGAADLTFASLSAAVIWPSGYGVALPDPASVSPACEALVRSAREHPAGRHALRMFETERRPAPALP
jgi:glutathione S-transferase